MVMSGAMEVEIKLACGAHHARALLKHPVISQLAPNAHPTRNKLINVYFDTDDHELRRQKMALRLRRIGLQWLQTLKASGERKNGVAMRKEWEMPVSGQAIEFSRLRDTPLDGALEIIGDPARLQPIFRVEFIREAWLLKPFPRYAPEFIAEVAFDHGQILAGDKTDRISEIELELKAGHVRELEYLAHLFMRDLKIKEEPRSKAKRGYSMLKGE